jgi:HSP90 family molecular chaperone
LIETLRTKQAAGSDGEALTNYAKTLYALAIIGEGGRLKDPGVTAQRLSAALAAELKGETSS